MDDRYAVVVVDVATGESRTVEIMSNTDAAMAQAGKHEEPGVTRALVVGLR